MRRWSTAILAAVVMFAAGVSLLTVFRDRGPASDAGDFAASAADYRIKEVRLREETRTGAKWQLDAEQAEVFEEAGKTSLRKVVIRIEDRGRIWTVTGDEGDLAQATKDVELRGHVVVVTDEGLRLETSRLRWDGQAERAWTEDPVTLYRSGAVVKGVGLSAKVADETVTVSGPVRATLGGTTAAGQVSR